MKKIFKKLISVILAIALCLGIYPEAMAARIPAANDGYAVETELGNDEMSIFNFNDLGAVLKIGTPSKQYCEKGKMYSVYWQNISSNRTLNLNFAKGVPVDWTYVSAIYVKIYNPSAIGQTISFRAHSTNSPTGAERYYTKDFYIPAEVGYQEVKLTFADLSMSGEAPDITKMNKCSLSIFGNVHVPGLYITDIRIKASRSFVDSFYSESVISDTLASLENGVAVYGGGSNVVTSEGASPLGYTAEWKNQKTYVPVEFFVKYLGAIPGSGDVLAELDGKMITKSDFSDDEIYETDSKTYVFGEKAATLLGLEAYTDLKLLVIGDENAVETVRRLGKVGVNEPNEIASYLAYFEEFDASKLTPEDTKAVKKRWLRYLVGDETTNDLSDNEIKERVDKITSDAKKARSLLVKGDENSGLFKDIVWDESADLGTGYSKIRDMAYAYACYGSELYQDKNLLEDILYCLDWMEKYRYSTSSWITGFNNWYHGTISAPTAIGQTLICIEDDITQKQIDSYLAIVDKKIPKPKFSGANYAEISSAILASGLLQNKYDKVISILQSIEKMYMFVDDNKRITESQLQPYRKLDDRVKGSGFFTDGSYVYHTLHPYNGGYGLTHFGMLCFFETILTNTPFDTKSSNRDKFEYIYDTVYDPHFYGSVVPMSLRGRASEASYGYACSSLASLLVAVENKDESFKNKIYSIIKKVALSDSNLDSAIRSALPVAYIKQYNQIMADDSIEPREDRYFNKVFYNMDRVAHERGDWYMSLAMSSSRIFNYESINSGNPTGWYEGDGRTEYYLKNSDTNATYVYWSSMDGYRVPGTTVDTQERAKVSIIQGDEYLSSKDFVGGVSLGGEYGVAAMDLESFHNEVKSAVNPSSYGGPLPLHQNDLTAKKGYFMFDDEVVCIGSAVNAQNNNNAEVLTIVDSLLAENTVNHSDELPMQPYKIVEAVASATPEAQNVASNTIDGNQSTKWAGQKGDSITWDIGEVNDLGILDISLASGSTRTQALSLSVSENGTDWIEVFNGNSSGKTDTNEMISLTGVRGRYVKYTNFGNSSGSVWVSITECNIYPPNPDGTIEIKQPDIYGTDPITVDGKITQFTGDDSILENVRWINANDICGYVFPNYVSDEKGVLKARWTKGKNSLFQLWFSHGINPISGSYAYILLPNRTKEQTEAYAKENQVEILSNTGEIQAVRKKNLGTTGIIFWKEGTFEGISVNKPCIVMYSENETGMKIAVSDPTQKLSELKLTITGEYNVKSQDDCASVSNPTNNTVVTYDMTGSAGRSMECVLEK